MGGQKQYVLFSLGWPAMAPLGTKFTSLPAFAFTCAHSSYLAAPMSKQSCQLMQIKKEVLKYGHALEIDMNCKTGLEVISETEVWNKNEHFIHNSFWFDRICHCQWLLKYQNWARSKFDNKVFLFMPKVYHGETGGFYMMKVIKQLQITQHLKALCYVTKVGPTWNELIYAETLEVRFSLPHRHSVQIRYIRPAKFLKFVKL